MTLKFTSEPRWSVWLPFWALTKRRDDIVEATGAVKVADMVVDMVADMEVDKVTDMVVHMG